MGRPERKVEVHSCVFEHQIDLAREAINCISKKDSLNKEDIQAIKILIKLCEFTVVAYEEKNELSDVNDICLNLNATDGNFNDFINEHFKKVKKYVESSHSNSY